MNERQLYSCYPELGEFLKVAAVSSGGLQGVVNPFKLLKAYLNKFVELGGSVLWNHEVSEILLSGDKVAGVKGKDFLIEAPLVVNCAGLNSEDIMPFLPASGMRAVRGVILCTDPIMTRIPFNLMSTDFLKQKRPEFSLIIEQSDAGNFLIGSNHEDHRTDSVIEHSTITGLASLAVEALPFLKDLKIIRIFTGNRDNIGSLYG